MARRTHISIPVFALLTLTGAALAAEIPVTVSPGDDSKLALIEARCPTFSWGEVEGAKSYELVVYRVEREGERAEPVLRQSFPGSVESWTPSLSRCLSPQIRYAWSVRALLEEKTSDWSTLRFFRIADRPDGEQMEEALGLVRRWLEATGYDADALGADRASSSAGEPGTRRPASRPAKASEVQSLTAAVADLWVEGLVQAGQYVGAGSAPIGAVLAFAGPASAVPQGWLLCDGQELDPDTHPDLFAVLGTAHGGDAFSFRIPDYRGRFLRGVDGGAGRDPDASARTVPAAGGNAGDLVGSVQNHLYQTHSHSITTHRHSISTNGDHHHGIISDTSPLILLRLNDDGGASGKNSVDSSNEFGNVGGIMTTADPGHFHTSSFARGEVGDPNSGGDGSETRPKNVYVNFIIRCGPADAC